MANRAPDYGMDVAISRKLDSRYDPAVEAEVLNWIAQITNFRIPYGMDNVHMSLKNGQVICSLIAQIYERTPVLPPLARQVVRPIRYSTNDAPFNHMENIQLFLNLTEAYGVPRVSLFQTVDLYENRNMAQVLNTLLLLGTECQRNGFHGPICGPRPSHKNRRAFTTSQLRSGEGIIGLQSGTNKFASQAGMSFGGQRHIADIRCDDITQEGQAVIGLQMGTNKFASQKGMNIGATRHIADMKIEDPSLEGQAVIGLQMGTNRFASQKGMRMGASRHVADLRVDQACPESQSIISLQYGTNKFASQSGMRMGGQRHIADIRCEPASADTSSDVSLQMGLSQRQGANQSGMTFGGSRQIVGNTASTGGYYADTSNDVSLQMGLSQRQAANQSGMTFGGSRQIVGNTAPTSRPSHLNNSQYGDASGYGGRNIYAANSYRDDDMF